MVNRHRAYWSSMSNSKYDFNPEQLDKDFQKHKERYESKKQLITDIVDGLIKSDPVRKEETFSIFIEILKERKENNESK